MENARVELVERFFTGTGRSYERAVRANWLEEFAMAFREHGFVDIEIERLTFGSAAIISAVKKRL